VLHKLLHKVQKKGILTNSFYEASITLIPKPSEDTGKKNISPILRTFANATVYPQHNLKNYRPKSLMNIDVKILKTFANRI
jgi:hypothetical protein